MTSPDYGSPLSPGTWLRVLPGGGVGFGRAFVVSFALCMVGPFVELLTSFPPIGAGQINAASPWVLLAAARWMSSRRVAYDAPGHPSHRLRVLLAVVACTLWLSPSIAQWTRDGMFRLARRGDHAPVLLSFLVFGTFTFAVPMAAALLGLLPRGLWRLLRPLRTMALTLGASLTLVAAGRSVSHRDPGQYLAGLEALTLSATQTSGAGIVATRVGRCTVWNRNGLVRVTPPPTGPNAGEGWTYPGYRAPLRIDRARGVLYVADYSTPTALNLATCQHFVPSLGRLAYDLAPPRGWTLAAVLGLVLAGLTLRRGRARRRTFGDPTHWHDAHLDLEGVLTVAGHDTRLRVMEATGYVGPVVLLRGVPAASQYRDAPLVRPEDWVATDRASLQRAIDDARMLCDAEALAYVVTSCTPLFACARLGLLGAL